MSVAPPLSSGRAPSWRAMLLAVPVRNAAARVAREGPDQVSVSVGVRRPAWLVAPLAWVIRRRGTRTVKLDRLGSQVWDLCDGEKTVEQVVDAFAQRHRLSFHEARAAVTGYLRELVRRGTLAMAMEKKESVIRNP